MKDLDKIIDMEKQKEKVNEGAAQQESEYQYFDIKSIIGGLGISSDTMAKGAELLKNNKVYVK